MAETDQAGGAKCGVKSPLLNCERGTTHAWPLSFIFNRQDTSKSGSVCAVRFCQKTPARPKARPKPAGQGELSFPPPHPPLSSLAKVIITTAREFVRLGDKDRNDSSETRQSWQTATRIEITSAFELATLLANLDQSEHFSIEDGIKLENE